MDFTDSDELRNCLSIPLTSDSEFSNDESTFPRVHEVIEIDSTVNPGTSNLRSGATSISSSTSNKSHVEDSSHLNILKVNRKLKNTKYKKDFEEITDNIAVPEIKLDRIRVPSVAARYEQVASEDCSSDNEPEKPIKPTRRKRTASGTSVAIYECPFEGCGKEFNRPYRLADHKRKHTGERPHHCSEEGCDRSYIRKQHLQRHIASCHQKTTPQEYLKCDKCDKILKNKYSLAKHVYRAHVRESFKCDHCGKGFRKQQHLRTHSYEHTGIKPYSCEHPGCGEQFLLQSRLNRHSLQHLRKIYACPNESCNETFDKHNDLRRHLSVNHMKVCDICGQTFKNLAQLKYHRKSHDDVREAFFCPYANCERCFYEERNLTKHIRDKHEETNIYHCGICNMRLSTKQKLALHMAIHSPSYKRSFGSHKPRKPRKDKGVSRTDYARLLSGYAGDDPQVCLGLVEQNPEACTSQVVTKNKYDIGKKEEETEERDITTQENASDAMQLEENMHYAMQSRDNIDDEMKFNEKKNTAAQLGANIDIAMPLVETTDTAMLLGENTNIAMPLREKTLTSMHLVEDEANDTDIDDPLIKLTIRKTDELHKQNTSSVLRKCKFYAPMAIATVSEDDMEKLALSSDDYTETEDLI